MKLRPAFTLIELMMVIAITVILLAAGLRGMVDSQKSFLFNNAVERVLQIVREARSLAVTGKAQLDYTDYDQDGCNAPPDDNDNTPTACTLPLGESDYVTPANYGVYFDVPNHKVTLFADLHADGANAEGNYVAPTALNDYQQYKDLSLAEFDLTSDLDLKAVGSSTIFYSPIFADTSFESALSATFFAFGVKETDGVGRERCFKIHPIAGVPEVAIPAECT